MAPRKKNIISPKKSTERKRVKKEQEVLKKPTVYKIKIPSLQQTGTNINSPKNNTERKRVLKEKKLLKKPTVSRRKISSLQETGSSLGKEPKHLSMERKIELANEVALAQLKKDAEIDCVSGMAPANKSNKNKKDFNIPSMKNPRGRKPSKTLSEYFVNTSTTVHDPEETEGTVEQISNKRAKKKTITMGPGAKSQKPQIRSADTTIQQKRSRAIKAKTVGVELKTRTLRSSKVLKKNVEESPTLPTTTVNTGEKTHPQVIESRTNSTTSNLSWTRDISTSSTTTCVTVSSNNVLHIDKFQPVVKLEHCDLLRTMESLSSTNSGSQTDTTEVASEPEDDENSNVKPDCSSEIVPDGLNLSLSSSSDTTPVDDDNRKQISSLYNQIQINQDNVLSEIMELGPKESTEEIPRIYSNILNVLTLENDVLKQSRYLRSIICDEEIITSGPGMDRIYDNKSDLSGKGNEMSEPCSSSSYDTDNINDNNTNYTPFADDIHENEDALSLFAESITDFESSRINVSLPDYDEYVPQSVAELPRERFAYRPTKITNNDLLTDGQNFEYSIKGHVEKKNNETIRERCGIEVTTTSPNCIWKGGTNNRPLLIASMYKQVQGIKSCVFKGVCFYNLISGCKNVRCRYRHGVPELKEVEQRLAMISEDSFIQEYILMRAWPTLRRKYGLCYVHECDKRELTNVLVEMGIDFVAKANLSSREDTELKVIVLETVLMHLNRVPLEVCADLLRYCVGYVPFSHTLMKAIADTQNFSRFKAIFIKLSKFIIDEGGSFDIDTVAKILERVCILPLEEHLVRAMTSLIQNTDTKIYSYNMMTKFRELVAKLSGRGDDGDGDGEVEQQSQSPSRHRDRPCTERNASPDTTNNTHTASITAPKIIRTIDMKRVINNNMLQKLRTNFSSNNMNIRRPLAQWRPRPGPGMFPLRSNTERQVSYRFSPLFKQRPAT